MGIDQESSAEKPRRSADLSGGLNCPQKERQKIPERSHAKASDGDQHNPYLKRDRGTGWNR